MALGLVLVLAGTSWRYPVLATVGLILLTLVGTDVLAVLRAPAMLVRRTVEPQVVLRGGACRGTLQVSGVRSGPLTAAIDIYDRVADELVAIPFAARSRAGVATLSYAIPTRRRGLMAVGPAQVHRRGVAGMAMTVEELGEHDVVRVLPQQVPLAGMVIGHRRAVTGGDDSAEQGGTDLIGLHEYTMGEDLRRLHWATSARTGTLMVREDSEPSQAHVVVLLDDRASSYGEGDRDHELFEEAVELAAAMCRVSIESGNPLRFQSVSDNYDMLVPGSATRQPRRESRELDWLLAEVPLTDAASTPTVGTRDLDIAVAITGPTADLAQLAVSVAQARTRIVAVLDPSAHVRMSHEFDSLVIRERSALELARVWDAGVRK